MNNNSDAKYHFSLSLLLLLIIISNIKAAEADSLSVRDDQSVRVDSIKISGNETTQDFIIRRELTFNEGDTVTGKILRYNRERIYSLRLFNRVDLLLNKTDRMNILEIKVAESWYLYPIPFFKMQNGDIKRSTYGINLTYKNFRGKNETLRFIAAFGYETAYAITYDNPALIFSHDIGLNFTSLYAKINNQSASAEKIAGNDFQYKASSQFLSLSKRFDQFNFAFLNLGFSYLETDYAVKNITASGKNIDRVLSAGLSYSYDSRDLKQYSGNGSYFSSSFTHKGFGMEGINYNLIDLDIRNYRYIYDDLIGKFRISMRNCSGGTIPFYDYSYLGYHQRVRGHMNEIREGKNYLFSSVELSYPLVKEWNVSIKLPLLPENLTSARIGIYMEGFADTGDAFDSFGSLKVNNFYSGYGAGILMLFLPFNAVRFEYAVNEFGKGEFVIDTGFSF